MSIAIADTSPISYLCQIKAIEVLPHLFHSVILPATVFDELSDPRAPIAVAQLLRRVPSWIRVQTPTNLLPLDLDAGEQEAISLAVELGIDAVLVDERRGRNAARTHGLTPLGTLGILNTAAKRGLIDFEETISRLLKTNFRVHRKFVEDLITKSRRNSR